MARALALSGVAEPLGVQSSSVNPSVSNAETTTAAQPVASPGEIPPVWNAVAFRRSFPDLWAEYLKATYRTAYGVHRAFGIDSHTARDWISGKRDPSGSFVAAVCARDPRAIEILGRAA